MGRRDGKAPASQEQRLRKPGRGRACRPGSTGTPVIRDGGEGFLEPEEPTIRE